jgi:hypothetical protein
MKGGSHVKVDPLPVAQLQRIELSFWPALTQIVAGGRKKASHVGNLPLFIDLE